MSGPRPSDPTLPRRRARRRGFQPAAGLVADQIRLTGEGRGFAASRVLTHWPEVVGAEIAALCRPLRVTHARSGFGATLVLLTSGVHGPRLEMMVRDIRDKVNACYGWNAIARVTLTQTAPTGFAEGQAVFSGPPRQPAPPPSPAIHAAADAASAGIDDPELAAAVRRFATLFLSRRDASSKGRNLS